MPSIAALAAMTIAALLSAWGARRDLQLPMWVTFAAHACAAGFVSLALGPGFAPLACLTIICLLIIETDRRHQLIPDTFTLAVLALALVAPFGDSAQTQVLGAAALGLTFLLIRQTLTAMRGAEALGWGDVKLAVAMGALLGPYYGFAAVALAGAATLFVMVARAGREAIALGAPFGIGLAAATAAVAIIRAALL